MTDVRIPVRWLLDRRFRRLTDRAYRAFFSALCWSVENRTDGIVTPEDLAFIPGWPTCVEDELAAAGLFEVIDVGWLITEFARTQTSKAEHEALDKAREANRMRQARYRANQASNVTNNGNGNGSSNGTKSVTTQAGKAGRQGPALPVNFLEGVCPDCEGTGWLTNEDGDSVTKCACRRRSVP
jgi:hypothetical protein